MKRNKRIAIFMALALMATGAQAFGQMPNAVRGSDVMSYTAWSTAINLGMVVEGFWHEEPWASWVQLGTLTAQGIPALAFGCDKALLNGGVQLGLEALVVGSALASAPDSLNAVLSNIAIKYAWYGVYDGYADLRSRSDDPAYGYLPRVSFPELLTATFDPSCYADWTVLGYLGSMAIYTGVGMALADKSSAVWTTGQSFIGNAEFPVWAGIGLMLAMQIPNFVMTGIGEESFFRGTLYEELSVRTGRWPAKIVDSFYFTTCHYPQQWEELADGKPSDLMINFALAMFQSMWFEYIYERNGLRSAVAAHAMCDIMGFFCDWLIQAGAPTDSGFSINNRRLSVSFGLRL
jgi:membrane protease YdiL (CAAX protease family)